MEVRTHNSVCDLCEHPFDSLMPTDDQHLETAALIALARRGERAWHHYAELVKERGSALAVLILTDQPDPDIAYLKARHRGHARVEDRIRTGKDTGMGKLPFQDFNMNAVWLEISLIAQDLLAHTSALCLDGELAAAEPKRLRYRLLHVAARITFHARKAILRLDQAWRWATALTDAFARLAALPPPTR